MEHCNIKTIEETARPTEEIISFFVQNNAVKFIFFNEKYSLISADKTVRDIHKLKSKYRGNTYVRIPLTIVCNEEDKYPNGIIISTDEDNADGFVLISKRDIWELYSETKYKDKKFREDFCTNLCLQRLEELNRILNGEMVTVVRATNQIVEVRIN
jgi:hypothetical protein